MLFEAKSLSGFSGQVTFCEQNIINWNSLVKHSEAKSFSSFWGQVPFCQSFEAKSLSGFWG